MHSQHVQILLQASKAQLYLPSVQWSLKTLKCIIPILLIKTKKTGQPPILTYTWPIHTPLHNPKIKTQHSNAQQTRLASKRSNCSKNGPISTKPWNFAYQPILILLSPQKNHFQANKTSTQDILTRIVH